MWKFKTFLMSPFSGFAALLSGSSAPTVSADQILGLLGKITDQFSIEAILALVGGVIGIGIVFVFFWWGGRKGFKIIMRAVTRGKISI